MTGRDTWDIGCKRDERDNHADTVSFASWLLIIGTVLITMVLFGTLLKRLPLSTAML